MRRRARRVRLVRPWRRIHGAVWLIGLAILAIRGWWWPGILVLIAISMLLEAALAQSAPQAFEEETPTRTVPPAQPPSPLVATPEVQEHRVEFLPTTCPSCGGPIRGHEVKWSGPQSADCPYCGANLPMNRGSIKR